MRKISLKIIALLLWGTTALLAGYEVFLVRHIVSSLYIRLLDTLSLNVNVLERLSATGIGNAVSVLMALAAVAVIIGGLDYHWSYGGERRSFILLGWTLGFQLLVLGLYIIV